MRIPKLLLAVIIVIGSYLILKIPSGHYLIPASVIRLYMFFIIVGVILVMTFSDSSAKEMASPIVSLLGDPERKRLRWVVFIILPLFAGYLTYNKVRPSFDAPVELRTVHPAPPSSAKVYDKPYNLLTLENPLRKDAANFSQYVREGGEIYFKNCFYCHGDKLNGRGHYAHGFNPLPANFQDVGTIAQLQESFVFWRVTTGGPGLPKEATPWLSAMPIWQHFLSEEEVWKVSMFIYDYTGRVPRVMKEEGLPASPDKEEVFGRGVAYAQQADYSGDTILNSQGIKYGVPMAYAQDKVAAGAKAIYDKRCAWCHGWEGAGDGPAAEFLNPRPRDFTAAVYKYKSSPYDAPFPTDEDLIRTISDGLPGTSMPAWNDLLSDKEIRDLVTYIKGFAGVEEKISAQVKVGKEVSSSDDSIRKGKELFIDRCSECHGEEARGDAGKALRTDWGDRVWPRDLTKPWTLRRGSSGEEIYTRVSTGIPGTPMPSFADPENKKGLSEEERWHVVNYVKSLQEETPREGESVVKMIKADGEISDDPMNAQWEKAEAVTFPVVPQIIAKERHFTPTITDISVKALYNEKEAAFLLKWDDRTKSMPGDAKAMELSEGGLYPDGVAIQWPVKIPEGMEKPYFGHGDGGHSVNIWHWSSGTTTSEGGIRLLDATGLGKSTPRDGGVGIKGGGIYRNGQWRVVMKRSLKTEDAEKDVQFEAGRFIPVAFAAWDGSNGETGSKHVLTTWYWAYPMPPSGGGVFTTPVIVMALVFGGEMLLARQVRKR